MQKDECGEYNADLLFLSSLFFFVFFCSVKIFRDMTERLSWSAIWVWSWRAGVVFGCGIVIPERPGLGSAPRAEWHSTAGRYGSWSKHLHLPCSSLTDWHTTPVGRHRPPTAIVRPSLHCADRGHPTERNQRWGSASWAWQQPVCSPPSLPSFGSLSTSPIKPGERIFPANISPQIFLLMCSVNNELFEMIINDA